MTKPTVGRRENCPADRHDTPYAYNVYRCRCPQARAALRAAIRRREKGRISGSRRRIQPLIEQTYIPSTPIIAAYPPVAANPKRGCANLPRPDVMFPRRATDTRAAETICQKRCPAAIREECLAWAIDTRQQVGTWGGLSAAQLRDEIARRTTGELAS